MKTITHAQQQERWEKEHKNPNVLLQMDASDPSSGVVKFYEWLKTEGHLTAKGLEMCCGKGRSVIWFAQQGLKMIGLDFSETAIIEAKARAKKAGVSSSTEFVAHDVTKPFPLPAESLDFAIDCFGSTDIESIKGRQAARDKGII